MPIQTEFLINPPATEIQKPAIWLAVTDLQAVQDIKALKQELMEVVSDALEGQGKLSAGITDEVRLPTKVPN